MPRKESKKKRKRKTVGVEAVVRPGVGALYVRGAWMKKLNEMGNRKRKQIKKSREKRKRSTR